MIQRQIPHPAGHFARCCKCGREPRHIASMGRSCKDGPGVLTAAQPARHSLECACQCSTGMYPTLQAAEAAWGTRHSQIPLQLSTSTFTPTPASTVTPIRRRPPAVQKEIRHG